MRRACIDIGSNTTRLLVAECDGLRLEAVHQERSFTRIGTALRDDGHIGPEKLAEVAQVVAGQLASAVALGVGEIRCVATAAVRRAVNAPELVQRISELCPGLRVEILSGEEEARLAFIGAARTLSSPPRGPVGVVDVGGGSSELVVGTLDGGVTWWGSFPLGSGDLAEACLRSDPPTADELSHARSQVTEVFGGVQPPPASVAVAVGGSATSMRRFVGPVLNADALGASLRLLGTRSSTEIAAQFELDAQRVRLLPAGLVILEAVVALFDAPLHIGNGGIREGLLLDQN